MEAWQWTIRAALHHHSGAGIFPLLCLNPVFRLRWLSPNSQFDAMGSVMIRSSPIAALDNSKGLDLQKLLSQMAADWRAQGLAVVGILAENNETEGQCSAAFLRDIVSGRRFSIHLDAAPSGTACHLDANGIGNACAELLPQIAQADVILLSKFGKTEAMRQGLWAAFSHAIAANKPLLTTVSPKQNNAWAAFAPEAARVHPDSCSIEQWWHAARGKRS